jgi:uncharacterized protein YbjT (DUF2867 family)
MAQGERLIMNIIITGATGMVGKGVLLYCLEDANVSTVLAIVRSPLGISHPKLKEMIQTDFYDFSNREEELKGYNACYFCLGTSSAGKSEAEYSKITYDLTIGFASILYRASPQAVFCYVSGEGTDSSEMGRVMWARVKGKTENAIRKMGFKDAYMFRPGFIKAMRGVKSKTKLYTVMYSIMRPFFPLIMLSKKFATDTDRIAKAMLHVATHGNNMKLLNTWEINRVAGEWK